MINKISSLSLEKIERTLFYLLIIIGSLGPSFLLWDLGPFSLFPSRIIIIILWLIFLSKLFYKNKLTLHCRTIRFYLTFLLIWLAYAFLSTIWAAVKTEAFAYSIILFFDISLVFFTIYLFNKLVHLKNLYYAWIASAFFVIPMALNLTPKISRNPHQEISIAFFNANSFAFYLAILFPFVLLLLVYKKKLKWRIPIFISSLFIIYLILTTLARAVYLAIILQLILLFFLLIKKRGKLIFTLIVLSLSIFITLSPTDQGKLFFDRRDFTNQFTQFTQDVEHGFNASKGIFTERVNILKNSLYFLANTYGFGVGAGNLPWYLDNQAYLKYYRQRIVPPHNWWIELYSDYGIYIFFLYLIFYIKLILSVFNIYNQSNNQDEKMIAGALFLALVSFSLANMSPSSVISEIPHWLVIGFSLTLLNYWRRKNINYQTSKV
jgi:teichuronic acid biosynthesis protein TuaE